MSLAQAHSVNEDNRLREELAELHQKRVSDALDLQLEESRFAQNLQEQANQHFQNSQEVTLEQFQAHFQVYKDRQREEHSAIVSELREQNDDLQDRLDSAERASEKALELVNPATPKGQPTPAPSTPKASPFAIPKAPQAPLFSVPNVLPQGARNLFDSMNPGGLSAHPPPSGNTTPGPAEAKASGVAAPPAADPGAPSLRSLTLVSWRPTWRFSVA